MDLQNLAITILALTGGVVKLTQWLKGKLGVTGWKALLLSAVVATIGALLTLWADGQLLPGTVSWGNVVEVAIAVFLTAQGFYFVAVGK